MDLASRVVAFDTETALVQPGLVAPPLVCASVANEHGDAWLLDPAEAVEVFRELLLSNRIITGVNVAFDMAVMMAHERSLAPLVFAKYDRDEVFDPFLAEQLHAIANGHHGIDPETEEKVYYGLDYLVRLRLGRGDAKENDFWRLRYAMLADIPIDEWPEEARQYPVDDAVNTRLVALAQLDACENLHDVPAQARAHLALHLGTCWGLRTDPAAVAALKSRAEEKQLVEGKRWEEAGLLKDRKLCIAEAKRRLAVAHGAVAICGICHGTGKIKSPKTGSPVICSYGNVQKAQVELDTRSERGEDVNREMGELLAMGSGDPCDGTGLDLRDLPLLPRTDSGQVGRGKDALYESGDPELMEFAVYQDDAKTLTTYVPELEKGVLVAYNPRSNPILDSGRVSYSGVIQLFPRKGGARECFVPRDGFLFCSTDYAAGELCTFAQVLLWVVGRSRMAEIINETRDPSMLHNALGARMLGVTLEEMNARLKAKDPQAKDFRQAAKPGNFGFPGGMGDVKFVLASRTSNSGSTTAPDGKVYRGIRFCILVDGAERCGEEMLYEYKRRPIPAPVCARCVRVAAQMRLDWQNTFDEVPAYFDFISRETEAHGRVTQFVSDRVRGGVGYTDGANTLFQGLLADGAKRAIWLVEREMYAYPESPLYGSRPGPFLHDDLLSEVPIPRAHEAATRQSELMVRGLREYTPDVFVKCEPTLMARWYKEAEPVYVDGRLVPWTPPVKKAA